MNKQTHYKVYVSSLLNSAVKDEICGLFEKHGGIKEAKDNKIELITIKNTSDIWMRDFMPIQIDEKIFVTYHYCPDYLWSPERHKYITTRFSTPSLIKQNQGKDKGLPFFDSDVKLRHCDLILDGGNIVICGDRIILTDKIFIENRPKSREHIIGELRRAFGKVVIIIPSDPYEIEDARKVEDQERHELPLCHADGVLAPIDSDSILIADYGEDPLGYVPQLMNALSPYFKPENIKHFDFGDDWTEEAWVYINFLQLGDVVLMPVVNYRKDGWQNGNSECACQKKLQHCNKKAERQLEDFLGKKVIKIDTTVLSLGVNENGVEVNPDNHGGALHCISWEVISNP